MQPTFARQHSPSVGKESSVGTSFRLFDLLVPSKAASGFLYSIPSSPETHQKPQLSNKKSGEISA